ncbi:hypothetical protein RhiirC2_799909 [Rhizophagus irregularis]|uniref:Uncharacterized protein n=1 Tax=Rhizophagus irregularis TaxID=588596 RepID=A0A2N1M4A6_9GLOM|nr:hypothetical protein RhiirC2_799909 [Rhizophagus irregularis]
MAGVADTTGITAGVVASVAAATSIEMNNPSDNINLLEKAFYLHEKHRSKGRHCPKFKKCKFPIFLENGGKL